MDQRTKLLAHLTVAGDTQTPIGSEKKVIRKFKPEREKESLINQMGIFFKIHFLFISFTFFMQQNKGKTRIKGLYWKVSYCLITVR